MKSSREQTPLPWTAATVGMAIGQNSDGTAAAAGVVVRDNSLKKVGPFMLLSRRLPINAR